MKSIKYILYTNLSYPDSLTIFMLVKYTYLHKYYYLYTNSIQLYIYI